MARYIARLMKDVLGANGHETESCKRSIEIEPPSSFFSATTQRQLSPAARRTQKSQCPRGRTVNAKITKSIPKHRYTGHIGHMLPLGRVGGVVV
jgi:hypothetical protein